MAEAQVLYTVRIVLEENDKDLATAEGTGDDQRLVAFEYGNPNVKNNNDENQIRGQLYDIYSDGKIRLHNAPKGFGFTAPGGKTDIYVTTGPEAEAYHWHIRHKDDVPKDDVPKDDVHKHKHKHKDDVPKDDVYIYTKGDRYWTFTADNGALLLVEYNDWLNPVQLLRFIKVYPK